jgi:hypothetical protein
MTLDREAFTGASNLEWTMDATTFSLNMIVPIGNVFRALVIGLNVFLVACRNDEFPPYPGSIFAYGGPILYLYIQVVGFFALLIYLDRGALPALPRSVVTKDSEEAPTPTEPDIDQETVVLKGLNQTCCASYTSVDPLALTSPSTTFPWVLARARSSHCLDLTGRARRR